MKLGSFTVAAALFLFSTSAAIAQISQSETAARNYLKSKLNVQVSNSCSIAVNLGQNQDGPFQSTDLCNESEFAGLKKVSGKVYRVVDGDTIHFFAKNKLLSIRMLGIDTPELHYLARAQPKWGVLARDSLRSMVQDGDIITLELDQVKCDHYGRILGHVFKGKTNVNFEQIQKGYAANYCIAPNMKHCNAYSMAYLQAAQERRGFHTDQCFITPYVWRRGMSGNPMDKKVKNSKSDEVYPAKDYYLVPVAYRVFYP